MPARDRAVIRDSWRIVDRRFSRRAAVAFRRDTGRRPEAIGVVKIRQMTGQLKMRSSP
jgi:hypothetical protein